MIFLRGFLHLVMAARSSDFFTISHTFGYCILKSEIFKSLDPGQFSFRINISQDKENTP